MRQAGESPAGLRFRGLAVVLWRAGLRISEALALSEGDLEPRRGAMLVRHGKGDKRREVGMDDWGWQQLDPWLKFRMELPTGALFCVLYGPTAGRPWSAAAARTQFRRLARRAGVRRRFAPHQLCHAHAVEMAHEGVPLNVIQRQLGRPRDRLGLPARDRQRRDRRCRPWPARPGDTGGRCAGSVDDAPATATRLVPSPRGSGRQRCSATLVIDPNQQPSARGPRNDYVRGRQGGSLV